jgi:hypothetical protein
MADIDALLQKVANHLAQRDVIIRWQNPPSQSAAGQAYKTYDGKVIAFVGNLTGTESHLRVLVHECLHGRLDYDILPYWEERKPCSVSVKRSQTERDEWREHPREQRVKRLTAQLMDYADRNAFKYWRTGRDEMTCKLLSLLEWTG